VDERSDSHLQDGGSSWAFHGSFERSVDVKGRFHLPSPFRHAGPPRAPERYVVSFGPDETLNLLPHDEFIAAFNRARRRRPGRGLRDELRRISHNSHVMEPDAQGRIAVPAEFLSRIGVEKRVLVVGMGSYLELWDPQRFAEHEASLAEPDLDLLDEFFV
jgi:MraZ protein